MKTILLIIISYIFILCMSCGRPNSKNSPNHGRYDFSLSQLEDLLRNEGSMDDDSRIQVIEIMENRNLRVYVSKYNKIMSGSGFEYILERSGEEWKIVGSNPIDF